MSDVKEIKEKTSCAKVATNPTALVIASVIFGGALGILFSSVGWATETAVRVLGFPGELWLKALKCIVMPMIIFAMVQSMVMLKSLPGAKNMGLVVVGLYTLTTLMAAIEGCLVSVLVMKPLLGNVTLSSGLSEEDVDKKKYDQFSALDSILNIFDGLVPKNLIGDAAEGYLLPVIVASIIVGLLVKDKNDDGSPSATLVVVGELNDVVVKVVTFLMTLTPVGVGSLVFAAVTKLDLETMGDIVIKFVLSVFIGLLFHLLVVYPTIVLVFAQTNPYGYVYNIFPALLTALGTSSSAASLPVTIRCCIEKNNIAPQIAKFVLSLGATINMDGTGLYLICAAFFLGTVEGVTFTFGKFATMSVLAMLCSLGTAPVPSASLVLLATIMSSVGIPLTSSFGLITAVDWLLDRLRTVVNVSGDASITAVADRFFGAELKTDSSDDDSSDDDMTTTC
jgi:Na+/H+-dicarboxylate symporter